ncbi:hypothetical protein CBL_08900 [Carabus blaptoides fortunei]
MFTYILKRSLTSLCSNAQKLSEINLVGRDYICPRNLTPSEIKSLLWTALDLKHLSKQRTVNVTSMENARVTLILDKPNINVQLTLTNAVKLLNASLCIVTDTEWKNNVNLEDHGRMLAVSSDIVFCSIQEQDKIEQIADGCNVPVVAVQSCDFTIVKSLSHLMSMQLHYGYLKDLTLGYVGLTGALINTYLCMFPLLGMNIKYCIVKDDSCTQQLMATEGLKYAQRHNTEIHECCSTSQTIYRTDVIASSQHGNSDYKICMKDMKEAAIEWVLLYDLPRGECDIDNEVFKHECNLTWKSLENCTWIYAAFMLRFLTCYTHASLEPSFNKTDNE